MLNKDDLREIKKYEDVGIKVVAIDNDGRIAYSSNTLGGDDYCDRCSEIRLFPDPDPYDWLRSGDMKAVCLNVNGVIEGSLEPIECTMIRKPIYCPKLGRQLNEEEKKEATKALNFAKKRLEEDT